MPDGPFLAAGALDVQTVGENWPTRLSAEQKALLTAPPASETEEDDGWDDGSWDGRRARLASLLTELLGYRDGKTLTAAPDIAAHHHIYRARVRADFAVHAPDDPADVRMVVICGPDATDDPAHIRPSQTHNHDGWVSTPVQRAALLARHAGADLALVTNGSEHLLVNVVTGTTGSAMWTVNGLEDRHARDAFVALLHKQRVLHRTVPLSRLIELSQDRQHELTDTLGKQVRRAAEALVNAVSRANRTSRGRLLEGLTGQQVYAATTRVLMRTVFLLVAEERGLLPVAENQLYADQYAMSTLLDKLDADAYRNRSAMERRSGAWQRMMALSRAVHAGIEHDDLRLPAYGGNLFDPDEHPFLEARIPSADGDGFEQFEIGVVDDFTVLTVLRHLQIANGQRISFRSLDVEQIGHVYEALLDHSAVIVPKEQDAVLGLYGKVGEEPEVSLVDMESWHAKSDKELGKQLSDLGVAAEARGVYNAMEAGLAPDSDVAQTLNVAVANDEVLRERVAPYAPLLRTDARGVALVFLPGDVYVTETSSKRDSGTAYTPRSLADEIAKHTLDPLIYDPGPQNEADESKWQLKASQEILDLKICDPAVGSAAILVAAVRYLAEALLQARVEAGELSAEALASGAADVEAVDARVHARRAVVARCVYGVDRDPMAVEMAKLSLWLITMARDAPFSFLDHAIRHGDSLLGITSLDQLRRLHLDATADVFGFDGGGLFADENVYEWQRTIEEAIAKSTELRLKLRSLKVRDISDALAQARLHRAALAKADGLLVLADAVTAICLSSARQSSAEIASKLTGLTAELETLNGPETRSRIRAALVRMTKDEGGHKIRQVFLHWPLEFPEVWDDGRSGFDAMIGNPPFLGGKKISKTYGANYAEHITKYVAAGRRGSNVDLVAYFFSRANALAAGAGLLATNTIAQGGTRSVALDHICDQAVIYRAISSFAWPSSAAVHVSLVWWAGTWEAARTLDGRTVPGIESDLYPSGRTSGRPVALPRQSGAAIPGQDVRGSGFILDNEEAQDLLQTVMNRAVIKPYVGGREVNAYPNHIGAKWAIDFQDWPEAKAQEFAVPYRIVSERVRPFRESVSERRVRESWWQYGRRRPELIQRLAHLEETIVLAQVSSRVMPVMVKTGPVFSHKAIVVPSDDYGVLGLLSSTIHRVWADRYSSTMKNDLSYSVSTTFNTFPFPGAVERRLVGALMYDLNAWRRDRLHAEGLTLSTVYGEYHNPRSEVPFIAQLRDKHVELDSAVAAAFRWDDLSLHHSFHQTRFGTFYTVSADERTELLMRLLDLNHAQAPDGQLDLRQGASI
ncbi:type IIL restriction-modification enzyme MmeI [Salsipaludibacter albus]|uniref:type IIL restriction-modification enzyme MmeI n=1 Tax=Salsipaludibacter albus TaxID=2849650 RepID=UPI001EE3D2DA|nr:type IIL restriction-modification enzyme MmeI [Salsipaludibacter albus]MBY5162094.1 hypothetical protein [Salsipaludibacter albus]